GTFSWKNLPPPKSRTPAIRRTMAPTTKAPIVVGLILLPMLSHSFPLPGRGLRALVSRYGGGVGLSPSEESTNLRLWRGIPQGRRLPHRQHRLRLGIEEDPVVTDRKNTRQLVGHHHDRGPEAVPQLQDQVIQPPRAQWIEPGRGLIKEQ